MEQEEKTLNVLKKSNGTWNFTVLRYLVLRCILIYKTNRTTCWNNGLWNQMGEAHGLLGPVLSVPLSCGALRGSRRAVRGGGGAQCAEKITELLKLIHGRWSLCCLHQSVMLGTSLTWFKAPIIHACLFPLTAHPLMLSSMPSLTSSFPPEFWKAYSCLPSGHLFANHDQRPDNHENSAPYKVWLAG